MCGSMGVWMWAWLDVSAYVDGSMDVSLVGCVSSVVGWGYGCIVEWE